MNTHLTCPQSRQRGIGLVEAMVALLVLALGMMTFGALQSRLRLNSDVAKQRAEAVRIAQEDIENFRAFGTFAIDNSVANNFAYDSILAGASTRTVLASNIVTQTNATYTVTRTVAAAPISAGLTGAQVKNVQVTVAWADRTAPTVAGVVQANQSVTLRTMVARSDPAVAASLALAPNGTPVRDLVGRDIKIPVVAMNLGDGTSAYKPVSNGTVAYVINNDTGVVTQRCTGISSTTVTNSLTLANLAGRCTDVNAARTAYLVSGFVRTSSSGSATNPNDNAPGGVAMRADFDNTAPPSGSQGTLTQITAAGWSAAPVNSATGVTIGSGGTTYTPAECSAEPLQFVRYTSPVNYTQTNNGNTTTTTTTTVVASIPQSVTSITSASVAPWLGVASGDASTQIISPVATGERFVGYSCLVYPIDLDLNSATALAYTARVTIWPVSGWALGTSNSTFKICRYSADYNLNGGVRVVSGSNVTSIDNLEHTYAYLNAQRSLGNQNFLIIPGNRTCPTDNAVEVNGQGGENYTDESTVTHQP